MSYLTSESGMVQWIIAGLHSIEEWWFAADDATARACGWQVKVKSGGLGRSYRDPRFDSRVPEVGGAP